MVAGGYGGARSERRRLGNVLCLFLLGQISLAARRAAGSAERSIDDRNAAIDREKKNRTGYTGSGGAAFGITPSAGRRGF